MRLAALLLAAVASAGAQPWDFESGSFTGWTQTGNAFGANPICKRAGHDEMSSTRFTDTTLGGDYWQDLDYPLGQHGRCVVTSLYKLPGAGTWSLTSPEFAAPPSVSFRVGGTNDPAHQRVEVQIRRGADWTTAFSATGAGPEQLHQTVFDVPAADRGLPARIRIVDDSPPGHINVDYICFTGCEAPDPKLPVWGYADYHTHPESHLAFGSDDKANRHIIWGNPGTAYTDYVTYGGKKLIADDIHHCTHGHGGGYLAEGFINNAQLFSNDIGSVIGAFLFPHKRSGGPQFIDFPDHLMGSHEQMHITMLRRNYEGGLRLMVALAVDNWGAGFLTGVVQGKDVPLAAEKDSVVRQIDSITEQVARNSSWMGIAKSPAEARDLIRHNKLAIILGVELDQLGQFGLATPDQEPKAEADFLWDRGVRVVTPIHAVNNLIGGPAILNGAYNWLNDFESFVRENHRQPVHSDIKDGNGHFFQVDRHDCPGGDGECVAAKLDPFPQLRLFIDRSLFNFFRRGPGFLIQTNSDFQNGRGFTNQQGLTDFGHRYLNALMDRGIIVDTAHMSDKSVREAHDEMTKRGYPAIISHAHFRRQGLYPTGSPEDPIPDYWASEYDISDSNLEYVRESGGVVGPFLHQARTNPSPESIDKQIERITDDCGNSSKGYAFAFHYAEKRVPGGVGFASDMSFIPVVSPRFGEHACEGFRSFKHGNVERKNPARQKYYNKGAQHDPVAYHGIPLIKRTNQSDLLKPYRMDDRTFDFNIDGLAHYGLVPDMLQDLKNVTFPTKDLDALFRSADGYIRMWEKVSGAGSRPAPRP